MLPVVWFALAQTREPVTASPAPIPQGRMPTDLMILLCVSIFYVPISQDMNIRAKSARTGGGAVGGFLGGASFYSTVVATCIYMGITLAKHGVKLDDPESAFTSIFRQYYPSWGILAVLAGMAAIWSTLDTYLVNTITSFSEDVIRKSGIGQNVTDRRLIAGSGLAVFVAAMLVALYFFKILALVLTALLLYISVLIPIACGRRMRVPDRAIFVLSVVIAIGIAACEWLNLPVNPKTIIYPASGVAIMLGAKAATLLRRGV